MIDSKRITALKIILASWLIIKLIALPVTLLTQSVVDLTFINPAAELGFQSLVFIKNTSLGLGVFIGFVVILAVGSPAGFLILPDSRTQNIFGLISYTVIILMDIVSVFILGFSEWLFILTPVLNLLILICLFLYAKQLFQNPLESIDPER